ncbi:hypothetical protein [Hymenobacter latericus]|uniref:hypothetical protein n=1 Tax=Hymenobacter sp. YIM 151858-1 TaxID=2987688 RepID=UPI00222758B2|nr:hypothetical protein [Hymenobacter sp. YIM 151858-1]UYZ57602.1 hypothetical protein OIS50_11025 [Hymenobacter sp. YIM 151858-1]
MRALPAVLVFLGVTTLLSACNQSVYYPLQPTVPMVTQARQAEITAGIDQNQSAYASATGIPVPHLLLTATASKSLFGPAEIRPRRNNERRQQQWEAGLGSYITLKQAYTVGLLAGYGQGESAYQEFVPDLSFSMAGGQADEYRRVDARFSRYYAQAYAVVVPVSEGAVQFNLGAAYRLSWVRYAQFEATTFYYQPSGAASGQGPTGYAVPRTYWHSFSVQASAQCTRWPAMRLQVGLGGAQPQSGKAESADGGYRIPYQTERSRHGQWAQAHVGLVLQPHYFFRKP